MADAAACLRRDVQNCPEPCNLQPSLQPDALLLTGSVPESYASLTSLTQVGLSGNLLTGTLPSWLATLPNLRVVGFNHNALTGSVGVLASGGSKLTYLHLGDNKLDGTIPKTVSHLSGLRYLYLENTLISGTIPAELGQLTQLTYLYLQKTRLVGTLPPELGNLTQLQYFCAGDCQIGGSIPAAFGGMQSLIFLGLYNMALSSTLPPSLGNISTLQYVVAHSNQLIGTVPVSYGNLSSLALFDAHDNKLYGRLPEGLVANNLAGTTVIGLDDTICASHPLAMSDYEYTMQTTPQGFSLSTVCPLRPCPVNTWSSSGSDSDGSAGGCQLCPPGSSIADLGGVASNNSAAHAGASACSTGDSSVRISAAALPVCATGYSGAPVLQQSSGTWSGCVRNDTIIGAVVGSVLGACFLVAVTLCLRRKRRSEAALQEIKLASGDRSTGSSGPDNVPDGGNSMAVLREDVIIGELLGTGGFAQVHAARWRGTAVAVKVFFADALKHNASVSVDRSTSLRGFDSFIRGSGGKDQSQTVSSSSTFAHEMRLLQRLRHPNICALYGVVGQTPPLLLMELCVSGSLSKLLRSNTLQTLGWAKRQEIGVGVACGVDFLHSQSPPVIHRDLKSANVVLSESLVPKICDFGLSSFIPGYLADAQANKMRGTPKYMAPELILTDQFKNSAPQAVDVFGIGVVLHDLAHLGITGLEPKTPSPPESSASSPSPPAGATVVSVTGTFSDWGNAQVRPLPGNVFCSFADAPTQELMSRYHHGFSVDTAPHCPPKLAAVISRCLTVDPAKRPTANQALNELLALTAAEAEG